MLRKVSVALLSAALTFATTPSFACTGISLKSADGAAIRARTLEFGFPMQSKVLVVPAGQEFSGTLPDGGKGLTFTGRYAFVGANALNMPVILDGLNDQGLSVGLFYFPGYASYTPVTSENAKRAIAPHEFGLWVLANFATVDEVKEGVKTIAVVPTPAPGLGSPQGMVPGTHFFIQDRSGKSLAIEPVDGTLKVHEAPLGVMTNAPTYDWHMTNLQNYINLTVKDVDKNKLGSVTLPAFGAGSGLHGLPGDFTPPSGAHSFDLPPGRSSSSWEGAPAVPARLLAAGGHLHKYGTALRFEDVTTGEVIWEARPVSARNVTRHEAASLGIRAPQEAGDEVRIVEVPGFDLQACGGTHPRHTAEVGVVLLLGAERYKQGSRVRFVCGRRVPLRASGSEGRTGCRLCSTGC